MLGSDHDDGSSRVVGEPHTSEDVNSDPPAEAELHKDVVVRCASVTRLLRHENFVDDNTKGPRRDAKQASTLGHDEKDACLDDSNVCSVVLVHAPTTGRAHHREKVHKLDSPEVDGVHLLEDNTCWSLSEPPPGLAQVLDNDAIRVAEKKVLPLGKDLPLRTLPVFMCMYIFDGRVRKIDGAAVVLHSRGK
jgi:hypothetical protein